MSDDLVKSCPFCGGTNIKSGGDDKVVGYWCLDCQAVGPNQYGRYEWNDRADRIEELEAKLAKAVEDLERIGSGEFSGQMLTSMPLQDAAAYFARTTLAELKGETDD